jgi:hypothetical protein
MKSLKNLGAAVVLTLVFGVPAFADCLVDPGILSTPPCAAAQVAPDDSVAPAETNASAASSAEAELLITEVAVDLIQSVLSLF